MLKINVLLVSLCCTLLSCNKKDSPNLQETEFTQYFGGNGEQSAQSFAIKNDRIYIAGTTEQSDGSSNIYFLVSHINGDLLLEKNLKRAGNQKCYYILLLHDGNFLLCASTQSGNTSQVLLLKINQLGDVLWEKTISTGQEDFPLHAIETQDGNLCIAANSRSTQSSLDILLLWVSSSGELLNRKTFGGPDLDGSSQIAETVSGELILFGYTRNYGAISRDFYLLRFNAQGDSAWSKRIDLPEYEESQAMRITQSGEIVLCGHSASKDPNHDMLAIKLNAKGEELWSKHFGGRAHDGGEATLINSKGNYVFVARSMSFGNDRNIYLVETSPEGKTIDERVLGSSGQDWAHEIKEYKGYYYLVGESDSKKLTDNDVLLIKRKI